MPLFSSSKDGSFAIARGLVRRHGSGLLLGLGAVVGVDLLQLYVPRLIKKAVDSLTLGSATAGSLVYLAAMVVGLALGMALLRMVWRPLILGFSRKVERELRLRLFDHLQDLHLGFTVDNPPGEIMARATNDLNNIRMATGIGLVAAVDGSMMALLAICFMAYISPLLTLLALLPMPLVVITTRVQSKRMHKGFISVQDSFAAMTEEVREGLAGIGLVKAYALMGRELGRLSLSGRKYADLNISLARVLAFFFPLMVLFTNVSLAVVLGAGGPMTVLGRITPGEFVAFSAYLNMLTWPMMALGWVVTLTQRAKASFDRVDQVLLTPPGIEDPENPAELIPRSAWGIEVRNLTFTYPGAEKPALRGVSFEVPSAGWVALVGRVASGKSTLLSLLGRLYDPPRGSILVEGVDIINLGQKELRRHVVQVPQDAYIFSASVRANLQLSGQGVDEKTMWAALEAAELAGEVRSLEQGLDTLVGEKGHTLSGGQRQRLALARALVQDPPVLVLDDPLSAVDTRTEARILVNLASIRRGRTNLVVSHRLAPVSFAQRIYVLEGGEVKEMGAHHDLLAAGGIYHRLFAQQALQASLEE